MLLDNFSDLFQRGLEYAWDCETLLSKQLPKMIEAASTAEFRQALELHLAETKKHIFNLEQIFTRLDRSPAAEKSEPIRVIIEECDRIIGHLDKSPLLDAALLFAANQVEYYEIGLYQSLVSFARTLGMNAIVTLLDEVLTEEKSVVMQMARLADIQINPAALNIHNTPPFALI